MGGTISSLYESKAVFERKVIDHKRQLIRALSKSNSMESLDKTEINEIKTELTNAQAMLIIIDRAIADESAPSF